MLAFLSGLVMVADWKVSFEIKAWGNWKKVQPGASVCNAASCGYSNDGGVVVQDPRAAE